MKSRSELKRTTVRVIARLSAFAAFALVATSANADFHTYKIEQIFSNADGSVQFIVMHEAEFEDGQEFWTGHSLTSMHGGTTSTFTFPHNLPRDHTAGTRALIATQGFVALGLITPDFVVPNGFLGVPAGDLNYGGVDEVAYATLPADGVHAMNRDGVPIANLATNFAGETASVAASTPPPAINYEGLWWKSPAASESGWGINFAHQGPVIFATWFTYDATGKAWWLVMTANQSAPNVFTGTLFQTRGPAFNTVPFSPSAVSATAVGSGTLTFNDANNGTFAYTVNGVSQTKAITRQVFGPQPTCTFGAQSNLALATNYQDLWWASPANSESGWGINFTHQGDTIFATWFTYDLDGTPLWLVVTANKSAAGVYSGTLYRTTGSPFSAVPFDPSRFVATPVGTATLTFTNGNAASFAYTVNGVSQTKAITRQVFTNPGTVCN